MPSWKERKGFRKKGTFDLSLEGKSRYSSGQLERKIGIRLVVCNASYYHAYLKIEMVHMYN